MGTNTTPASAGGAPLGGMPAGKFREFLYINDVGADMSQAEINLEVNEYVALQVANALADDADAIKGEPPAVTPAGAFGGASIATELQGHVEKAHTHVIDTLHAMSQGVHGYSQAVSTARKTVLDADDDSNKAISGVDSTLNKSTKDVSTPFSNPTTTSTPTSTTSTTSTSTSSTTSTSTSGGN